MNTLRQIFRSRSSQIILGFFIFIICWLAGMKFFGIQAGIYNNIFSTLQGLLPVYAVFIALQNMKLWGGYRSKIGKAIFFMALGVLAWAIGELIWAYYNTFLNIVIPYPSFADLSFVLYYPLFGTGIFFLTRVTTIKTSEGNSLNRIYSICVPVMMAVITYYVVFLQAHGGEVDWGNPLKIIVDMAYPIGDTMIIVLIVISSGLRLNYIGDRLRLPIIITTLGVIGMYVSDFYFSYSTTVGTYYVGALADWLFTITLFLHSLGLSNLHPRLLEDK